MLECEKCGAQVPKGSKATICPDCGRGPLFDPSATEENLFGWVTIDLDEDDDDVEAFDDGDETFGRLLGHSGGQGHRLVEDTRAGIRQTLDENQAETVTQTAFERSQPQEPLFPTRDTSSGSTTEPLFGGGESSTATPLFQPQLMDTSPGRTSDEAIFERWDSFLNPGGKLKLNLSAAHAAMVNAGETELMNKLVTVQLIMVHRLNQYAKTDEFKRAEVAAELESDIENVLAGICTYHEFVAIADAAYQNAQNGADPMSFLTSSDWASLTGIVCTAVSLGVLVRNWKKMNWKINQEIAEGMATNALSTAQMVAQAVGAINKWTNPTADATSLGSIACNCSMVASGAGIGAGLLSYGIQLKTALDMGTIRDRYHAVREYYPFFNESIEAAKERQYGRRFLGAFHTGRKKETNLDDIDLIWLFWKCAKKIKRRKWRAAVGATGAASSTIGSSFALGTTVTVALGGAAAIPVVGWIAVGIALTCSIGALGYGIGRRQAKIAKLKRMRKEHPQLYIPPSLKTSGDFNRFYVAAHLYTALTDVTTDPDVALEARLWAYIFFGGDDQQNLTRVRELNIVGIMGYLKS